MANNGRHNLPASFSSADFGLLKPHLEPVTLELRKHLERANKRIDAVYFAPCLAKMNAIVRKCAMNRMALRDLAPIPRLVGAAGGTRE